MERRKSRKRPQESHRQSLMDTSHTTKGLGRMRREISKSRPSHAEMKSKKKKVAPSLPSCDLSRHHLATPSRAAVQRLHLVSCHCPTPSSTLPETGRVKASPGPVKQSFAASVEHWRQASWGTSRLGSSAGWMSGFEAAVCGMGRLCFRCQKIPQPAKTLSLQLQIDGCKTRPDKATSV